MDLPAAALPLATAAAAAVFAARIAGSAVRRYAPAKVFWAIGLLLAAAAAGAETYGAADGWGEPAFRVYYLAGGCLSVAFLGAGSAFLVLPRGLALVVLGALGTAVVGATIGVLTADLDPARLAAATDSRPPDNETIRGIVYLWAVACNSVGSLLLIGGSLWSLAHGRRVTGNVLIIVGVLAIAGSGTLSRLGSYDLVYVGQTVGLALMLAGFEAGSGGRRTRRARGLLGGVASGREPSHPRA